jgi:zinc transporter
MQIVKLNKNSTDVTSTSYVIDWIDLDMESPESIQWLKKESKLNEDLINILIERNYSNRRRHYKYGTLINLCHTKQASSSDTIDINFLVEDNRVITVHWGEVEAITKFNRMLKNDKEPTTCWGVLASVVSMLSDEMEDRISEIGLEIDKLEDQILESNSELPMDELASLRRRLMRMRRYQKPLANLINNLSNDMTLSIDKIVRNQMSETSEQIGRDANTIESYMERAMLMQDQIQNQLYDRMNRATYRLGVVATVFLPLGFITGLLGINVAGIPGDHNHYAFWMVCLFLVVVAIVSTILVSRKKEF